MGDGDGVDAARSRLTLNGEVLSLHLSVGLELHDPRCRSHEGSKCRQEVELVGKRRGIAVEVPHRHLPARVADGPREAEVFT